MRYKDKFFIVPVKVKEDDLVNLLVSACESGIQGSAMWLVECTALTELPKAKDGLHHYRAMLKGFHVQIRDPDTGRQSSRTIDAKKVERGIRRLTQEPHSFARILTDEMDGPVGDVFMQLCVFGEVRYS